MTGYDLRPSGFDQIQGWREDDLRKAFHAFRRSADHAIHVKPYRQGSAAPSQDIFRLVFEAALRLDAATITSEAARHFFESAFEPVVVDLETGAEGKVTAFYEPVVEARRERSGDYLYPFLSKPDNLVKIPDPDNPPDGIEQGFAFALRTPAGLVPCPDRQAIESGAFEGLGLEIAWARDKVDVFFAHIQGSCRLDYGDGTSERITYAAKAGYPFTGIGRLLVARGEIPQADISMQTIRKWLAEHPGRADALMWENRSFIFFEKVPVPDERLGPVAAAKVPLEPGRSLAVDRLIHSFGTPIFVDAPSLADFDTGAPFARLMIAQDTGSAIVGPVRGDLFTGSGEKAGELAGAVNAVASFTLLLPRGWNAN